MRAARWTSLFLALALGASARARAETVEGETGDTAITPSLGRGYTPAINGFHSICFDTMPTTQPSFDFDYTFEDLELDAQSQMHRREELRTYEVDDFIERNTHDRVVATGNTKRYFHYILASLIVDSYYSAIDEAHAKISKDAIDLLQKGDLVSFFLSCGTHYVRSISRRSYFLTLFSYTSTEQARDNSFELKLETQVRRIHSNAKSKTTEAADSDFTETSRQHDLKIVTRAIGLAPEKSSDLLPFDIDTYQQAVKKAFTAAEDEYSGHITSMEIQPWMANTQILVLVNQVKYPGQEEIDWHERTRILSDNAEFYIELSRHLLDMTTEVHRAEACHQAVDDEVFKDGKLRPEYEHATIINQHTGERAPLSVLLEAVSDENIDKMRALGIRMRDGADGKSGATACMKELESTNLSGKFHNDIPTCDWSRQQLPGARVINEYCPPQIERPPVDRPARSPQPAPEPPPPAASAHEQAHPPQPEPAPAQPAPAQPAPAQPAPAQPSATP